MGSAPSTTGCEVFFYLAYHYPVVLGCLVAVYAVPLCRLVSRYTIGPRPWTRCRRVLGWIGRVDWAVHLLRESLGLLFWLVVSAGFGFLLLWFALRPAPPVYLLETSVLWVSVLFALVPAAISLWARRDHRRWQQQLVAFAQRCPTMYSQEFYVQYFLGFGPLAVVMPDHPVRAHSAPVLDCRSGRRSRWRCWPMLEGAGSILFLTSSYLAAYGHGGDRQERQHAFDCLSAIGSTRTLALGRLRLEIEGLEQLRALRGPAIFCCNHESLIDFMVSPIAYAFAELPQRGPLLVRYLVAKDHFLDNWLLYRGIRLGRAVEASGGIFVDRYGTSEQRHRAVAQAAQQMLTNGVDIAIYPQGTRAQRRVDASGELLPPGYYTVGSKRRLQALGGHMKKGAAHLALLVAEAMARRGQSEPLAVVPMAVHGAGLTVPKGGMRIRTESTVRLIFDAPLLVPAPTDFDAALDTLHRRVDTRICALAQVHERLRALLIEDLDGRVSDADCAQWLAQDPHAYPTLDCLYSNPPRQHARLVQEFVTHLQTNASKEVWASLYQQTVAGMC